MAGIDYSATPTPANGQPRSAAALTATFTTIQTAYNGEVLPLMTVVNTNATDSYSVATQKGTLVKRNATTGGINVGVLGAAPLAADAGAFTIVTSNAPAGHTGNLYEGLLNGVSRFAVSTAGHLVFTGQAIAGSGAVPITIPDGRVDIAKLSGAGTAGRILMDNGTAWASSAFGASAIADGSLPFAKLADYFVSPGSAGNVNIAAGNGYYDTNNAFVPALSARSLGLTNTASVTQPSGTNSQYVLISFSPTTGLAVATGGTVGPSPASPALPTGNTPKALVLWRGTTANPSGVAAATDITNFLPAAQGGGSGSGGGGGGYPTTVAVITRGDYTTPYPNTIFDQNWLGGGSTAGDLYAMLARHPTDAPLGSVFRDYIKGNLIGNFVPSGSSMTMTNPAGQQPIVVGVANVMRQLSGGASLTTPGGASTAGLYAILADVNGTGPGFTLQLTQTTPAAGQITLATIPWDGSSWQMTNIQYPVGTVNGANYRPTRLRVPLTSLGTVASTAGSWTLAGSPVTVYLPAGAMMITVRLRAVVSQPAAASTLIGIGIAYASGTTVTATNVQSPYLTAGGMAASTGPIVFRDEVEITGLAAGANTFQLVYITIAANVVLTGLLASGEFTLPS